MNALDSSDQGISATSIDAGPDRPMTEPLRQQGWRSIPAGGELDWNQRFQLSSDGSAVRGGGQWSEGSSFVTPSPHTLAIALDQTIARAAPLRRLAVAPVPEQFELLQQWEGTITALADEEVTAVLDDKTEPGRGQEQVVLPIDEFSASDRELLAVGAVFYWTMGYRTNHGTRERVSSIMLRRRLPPSKLVRARIDREAAALAVLFGGDTSHD